PGSGNRCQCSPMERALERNDAETLGLAGGELVMARHLDRAFDRLGAGVLKKHRVGKAHRAQPIGQPLGFRNAIQIGDVPNLPRLLLERIYEPRMGMPKSINSDAGGEIEVPLTLGRVQPNALAPLESEVGARISRQKMRAHGLFLPLNNLPK